MQYTQKLGSRTRDSATRELTKIIDRALYIDYIPCMDLRRIYRELVRRNVFRAVVAYLAVAWMLIQIASVLLPAFGAPDSVMQGLIYLISIGLLFWTAFSWVYDLTPDGIEKTPEQTKSPETRKRNSKRLNTVIAGSGVVAILLMLAGSFWAGSRWSNGGSGLAVPEYRLAVLPFEDRSDNAEYAYLMEGIAEELIGDLIGNRSLSVINSRSAFRFKDPRQRIDQVFKELHVDYLLLGSYSVTHQQVELRMEVIRKEDHRIMAYANLDGDLRRIRDLAARMSQTLCEALGVGERPDIPVLPEAGGVDAEAYKLTALGKSAMRDHTGQSLNQIIRYFETASKLDPDFVDAYIGMAEAYIFDVNRGYLSPVEGAQKAREYALKAEKLDPGRGEVSGILGIVHCFEFDFRNALPYFERSIEKSPNFSLAYHWYAFALEYMGEFEKAEELLQRAGVLDPLNVMNEIYLVLNYLFQGDLGKAAEAIDSKLAMEPDHKEMLWMKAVVQAEQENFQEALRTFEKRGMGLETNFMAGYIFARLGMRGKAVAVLDSMLERVYVSPSQLSILYCGLEDYDRALDAFENAYLIHDQWIMHAVNLSMTDPIKGDPRFISVVNQLRGVNP